MVCRKGRAGSIAQPRPLCWRWAHHTSRPRSSKTLLTCWRKPDEVCYLCSYTSACCDTLSCCLHVILLLHVPVVLHVILLLHVPLVLQVVLLTCWGKLDEAHYLAVMRYAAVTLHPAMTQIILLTYCCPADMLSRC